MKRLYRYFRSVVAAIGFGLMVMGLLAAYWWHYRLAPTRHLIDPAWRAAHSEAARWKEEQEDYRRVGSSPDLCFRGDRIGFYGDKKWFLWLDARIRHPDGFRHCGCTDYALALMANRYMDTWANWTDANLGRSQEEWIRDGFLDYGVTVHLPPTPDDRLPLLRLLGRKSTNAPDAVDAVPSYIHYNAYRWLRDSGFDPSEFASSNSKVFAEPGIVAGLTQYCQWYAAYPGHDGLGVLAFRRVEATGSSFDLCPRMAKQPVVVGVDVLIWSCTVGGAVLVLHFVMTRRRRRQV